MRSVLGQTDGVQTPPLTQSSCCQTRYPQGIVRHTSPEEPRSPVAFITAGREKQSWYNRAGRNKLLCGFQLGLVTQQALTGDWRVRKERGQAICPSLKSSAPVGQPIIHNFRLHLTAVALTFSPELFTATCRCQMVLLEFLLSLNLIHSSRDLPLAVFLHSL